MKHWRRDMRIVAEWAIVYRRGKVWKLAHEMRSQEDVEEMARRKLKMART